MSGEVTPRGTEALPDDAAARMRELAAWLERDDERNQRRGDPFPADLRSWADVLDAGVSLWVVYNGFQGNGRVGVLLEADTEQAALDAATEVFKADVEHHPKSYWLPSENGGARVWEHLDAVPVALPWLYEFG